MVFFKVNASFTLINLFIYYNKPGSLHVKYRENILTCHIGCNYNKRIRHYKQADYERDESNDKINDETEGESLKIPEN